MQLNEHEQALAAQFDRGCSLRDSGDLEAAVAAFSQLIAQLRPEDTRLLPHSYMQLANCLHQLGRNVERETAFRSAVESAPRNELASVGWFHSLLALERRTDAHREMLRFLRVRDSELYRELLSEGYGEDLTDEDRELVQLSRQLLNERS